MRSVIVVVGVIFTLIHLIGCQLYFPDEFASPLAPSPAVTQNLTQLRGTSLYEEYIDKIIARGLIKTTLAVDKAVTGNSYDYTKNIVYAPVSIAAALALVLLGANGRTFEEVATIMGLATGVDIHSKSQIVHEQFGRMIKQLQATSGFSIGNQVNFATAIFVQEDYPIRSVYKQVAHSIYESEILNVDFKSNPHKAQDIVNNWVKERTFGKIPTILKETPLPSTKVILTSAMYFKAAWEKPFFSGVTRRRPFYTNGRGTKSDVMVDMMSNGGYFPYYKDNVLNCEIMGFPYKGNHTTMFVILPFNSNRQKIKEFKLQLNASSLERLVENVRYTRSIIIFPKMKIDSTIDLKDALQILGLKSLFNPHEANLALLSSGIQPTNNRFEAAQAAPLPIQSSGVASMPESMPPPQQQQQQQQEKPKKQQVDESVLIFSRLSDQMNCTNSENNCGQRQDRKIDITETLDGLRQYLNQQGNIENFENPGLYADSIIHKVYMDITESGTEAAAATSVTLARDGGSVTFRVDVPFIFFIRHEQSKTILFWGSVNTPTPSFI